VQEAAEKVGSLTAGSARWHLIGHLQSNKARLAAATFDVIHTVDTAKLVERLDRAAAELSKRIRVLIQIDLGREPAKSGIAEAELAGLVPALEQASNLELSGLMTLPPYFESPEKTRPYFQRLAELLKSLNDSRQPNQQLRDLSMGMSHDFEVAIEEGATMVRIGTAIFGTRS
jgi:pyridoxal phosphate enzyme (YggS family)